MSESAYQVAYKSLNDHQREAVDHIDGPLLVIAGPGTGKTQLLSTRAARIVELGSASPQNILCLTFTESGASAMRERLLPGGNTKVLDMRKMCWMASRIRMGQGGRSFKP